VCLGLALTGCGLKATKVSAPVAAYPSKTPAADSQVPAWMLEPQKWQVGDWYEWKDDRELAKRGKGRTRLAFLARTDRGDELWETAAWKEGEPKKVHVLVLEHRGAELALGTTWEGVEGGEARLADRYAASSAFYDIRDGWKQHGAIPPKSKVDSVEIAHDDVEVAGRVVRSLRIAAVKSMGPARAVVYAWFAPEFPGRLVRIRGEGELFGLPILAMVAEATDYGRMPNPRPLVKLPQGAWPPA